MLGDRPVKDRVLLHREYYESIFLCLFFNTGIYIA
jgi:hypothetical protein